MKVHAWRDLHVLVYIDDYLQITLDGYKPRMVLHLSIIKNNLYRNKINIVLQF